MDVSVHFTFVLRPISFVSVRRKWRKYFSNREKKKKKISFLQTETSRRVWGEGEEGMATVGKWPCHTRELLWYEVMRTAKHARRYYVMFQVCKRCVGDRVLVVLYLLTSDRGSQFPLGGERERERKWLSIVSFYLDLFVK